MTRVVKRTPDVGLKLRLQRIGVDTPVALGQTTTPPDPGGCEVSSVHWCVRLPFDDFSSHEFWRSDYIRIQSPDAWYGAPAVVVFGVPLGAATGAVSWLWSWSEPPTRDESVVQSGPVLIVTVPPTDLGDYPDYLRILSATAYCGGVAVGSLELRVFYTNS